MKNLGICSITFRSLGHDKIINLCKNTDLNYIEWGGDVHVPETDLENANEVNKKTAEQGLQCVSYGSYYRCDGNIEKFKEVSNAGKELGAKAVRVWAGEKDSQEFSEQEFLALVSTVKKCALIAKANGQDLAFEFHHSTYCNTPESTLKLIQAVNEKNVKTYWQPMYWLDKMPDKERINKNLKSIQLLKNYILNVHVYQWEGTERYPLKTGANEWKKYIKSLPEKAIYYLEFVMGDTEKQFLEDAKILNEIFE